MDPNVTPDTAAMTPEMAVEQINKMVADKLQNLLKFTEYDHLQTKQKATKKTDVGGFAVLEKIAVGKDEQIEEIKKNRR